MPKPKGRIADIFGLPADKSGQPQTVITLDRLTHVPVVGDVLNVAGRNLLIAHVDKQRTRRCLTGWKLAGLGSIAVVVNDPTEGLRPLAQQSVLSWVTWTPKDDSPWHANVTDLPAFTRLNEDWNAHPNDVGLYLKNNGSTLLARMKPNPYVYRQYEKIAEIVVRFEGCSMYRVTPVNDQGWYSGHCRFSGLAPSWGEFYEISGNTQDDMDPTPWTNTEGTGARHFHFYLRDEALEVKAQGWSMSSQT